MARLMVGEVACAVWVGNKAAAVETLCMIKKVGLQRIQLVAQAQFQPASQPAPVAHTQQMAVIGLPYLRVVF